MGRSGGDGLDVGGVLLTVAYAREGLARAQRPDLGLAARSASHAAQGRFLYRQAALGRRLADARTDVAQARLRAAQAGVTAQIAAWSPERVEGRLRAALRASRDPDRVRVIGLSPNLVVTTGLAFFVDAWQGSVEPEILKYHGTGSGSTSPSGAQTNLVTPHTTQTDPDNTRATGTLGEGASATIFKTTATVTIDAATTLAEWALFTHATVGSGIMGARALTPSTVYGAGDVPADVDFEYEVTFAAA